MYYVYVYFDPRKVGTYCYDNVLFQYEPIYVGKGSNKRFMEHLSNTHNSHLAGKIKNIQTELNRNPAILVLDDFDDEQEALDFEVEMIKRIGRADLGFGPLTNKTDGGEGCSGVKWSEERRALYRGENNPNYKNKGKPKKNVKPLGPMSPERLDRHCHQVKQSWDNDPKRKEEQSQKWSGSGNPGFGKYGFENPSAKPLIFEGEYFHSIRQASEVLKISKGKIQKDCLDIEIEDCYYLERP